MVPSGEASTMVDGRLVKVQVDSFLIGRTEVTWDLYDAYVLRLDLPRAERAGADASSRPSRPYGAPDRGFGHRGYPAISITHQAAQRFAAWLSGLTGHDYRLATDAQWGRVASLAIGETPFTPARLDSIAWTAANAQSTTHPVATRSADRAGLFDLFGNAAEWVTLPDGSGVMRGGSYLTAADSLDASLREVQQASWNQRDPQMPKSSWWLSDGPFAGFRLVRMP